MSDVGVDPKKVLEDAMALAAEERAELAARLLASLTPPGIADEEALTNEVIRRAREVEAGTAVLQDWEDVRRDLERRFGKQ